MKFYERDVRFVCAISFHCGCGGRSIHSFLSEKKKGHKYIIVRAAVPMSPERLSWHQLLSTNFTLVFFILVWNTMLQHSFAAHTHMHTANNVSHGLIMLRLMVAEVKLVHFVAGSSLRSEGQVGQDVGWGCIEMTLTRAF